MRAPHANLLGTDETSQLGRGMAEQDDTLVVCCLRAKDFSGYSICACSLILHPICLSPGMKFAIYCELCMLD